MDKLKVLLAVESDSDAALVVDASRPYTSDITWLRAAGERAFRFCLDRSPDVIVCDLEGVSLSLDAIVQILGQVKADLPVIVLAGNLEDKLAAACLQRGAADYLMRDRLARTASALMAAGERFSSRFSLREAEKRLLAVAINAVAINDMRQHSLPHDPSESSIRAMLDPLFDYDALTDLLAVRVDLPFLPLFRIGPPSEDSRAGGEAGARRIEREIDTGRGGSGKISFIFRSGFKDERESAQFLDEVVQVVSEAIKQAGADKNYSRSLEEKDELLREIHHRVKNNLQSMQGLMSLAASRMPDGSGREVIQGLESQVQSMALVHGMLYSRGGFTGIDFEDYFRALKIRVAEGKGDLPHTISLSTDCGGFRVPLEAAVTLGILFNELLLHARSFAANRGAVDVSIAAKSAEDGAWKLEYREKYAQSTLGMETGSAGLELARLLLAQYEGSIEAGDELLVRLLVHCGGIQQACP